MNKIWIKTNKPANKKLSQTFYSVDIWSTLFGKMKPFIGKFLSFVSKPCKILMIWEFFKTFSMKSQDHAFHIQVWILVSRTRLISNINGYVELAVGSSHYFIIILASISRIQGYLVVFLDHIEFEITKFDCFSMSQSRFNQSHFTLSFLHL